MDKSPPTSLARLLITAPQTQALATGLLLGAVAGVMALRRRGEMFSFTMAVVLLVAGALTFVLYALDTSAAGAGKSRGEPPVHRWLGAIACGALIALQAIDLIAG